MYDDARPGDRSSGRVSRGAIYQHGLFNLGRTASYVLLGALFGALGGALYLTTESLLTITNVVRGTIGVGLGCLIVVHGLGTVAGGHAGVLRRLPIPGLAIGRLLGDASSRAREIAGGPGIVGLGPVHGLVPCPMLYAAFVYVFAVGSPAVGVAALGAFGLGTVPAVFLFGTALGSVDSVRSGRVHRLLGGAFVLLGYVLLAHGLIALGVHLPHPELPHAVPPDVRAG
jgi:sulfite exporter TauE/SafE